MGQENSTQGGASLAGDASASASASSAGSNQQRTVIYTPDAPKNTGLPYSQAVLAPVGARLLFTAGQLGIDPQTMKLVGPTAGEQARQAMKNLGAVLKAGGSSFEQVLKVTVFLNDLKDFAQVNEEYKTYFPGGVFPARSAFAVRELPLGGLVEIEAIAFSTGVPAPAEERATFLRADGKTEVPVYLFGKPGNPGVVVIQEWWGVTDMVKKQAEKIAAFGYRVAIPDIYRGKIGVDAEEASHLMKNLDWVGAIEDIRGVAQALKKEGSRKVGVIGFCMGGALSIASGTNLPADLDCAISFYGIPPKTLADPAVNAKIPMEGHFGEKDDLAGFSDPASAAALKQSFEKAGIPHNVYMYEGVGHAFLNDLPQAIEMKKKLQQIEGPNGARHDPAAIELAWGRVQEFFKAHL